MLVRAQIDEWVRQSRFADIEFRSFNGERQACVRDRLQVWQVIEVAQAYSMDVDKTAEHLGLTLDQTRAAMNYYEAYTTEIDALIADNQLFGYEQVKRLLSNLVLSEPALATDTKLS